MEQVRRDLLQEAARFYRRFRSQRGDDPRTRLAWARAEKALAGVAIELGDDDGARQAAAAAVAEFTDLLAVAPATTRLRVELADARDVLARTLCRFGEQALAQQEFDAAIADLEAVCAADRGDTAARRRLAGLLHNRGFFTSDRATETTLADYRAAIDHMEMVARAEPADAEARRTLVRHRSGLAGALLKRNDVAAAERELTLAREQLGGMDPALTGAPEQLEMQADIQRKLALVWFSTGKQAQARDALRAEAEIYRRLASDYPRVPGYRHALATSLGNLAVMLAELGEANAADSFRAAVRELDQLVAEFPLSIEYRASLATYSGNLALALFLGGRRADLAEAEALERRAIAFLEQRRRSDPDNVQCLRRLISVLAQLGTIQRADHRGAQAVAEVERAVQLGRDLAARHPDVADVHADLADALLGRAQLHADDGDHSAAKAALTAGLDAVRTARRLVPDNPVYRRTHSFLQRQYGLCLAQAKDGAAAAAVVDELLDLFDDRGKGHLVGADVLHSAWLHADGEHQQAPAWRRRAVALYLAAIEGFGKQIAEDPGDLDSRVLHARAVLGHALVCQSSDDADPTALAQALSVLATERVEGHFDPHAELDLARGYGVLAERLIASGDHTGAGAAADEVGRLFASDGERWFEVACLRARCARRAGPGAAEPHLEAAAAALRCALTCGFADVERVRRTAELEPVCARPEVEALLR
jgi:tetratricopeptide (TPR) repeat protein